MKQKKQVSKRQFKKKWVRWWILPVSISILVWSLFHLVFLIGYVPTESMEPALKKDSFLIASRLYFGLENGDIIVFSRDGQLLVKRIAAVSGEKVDLRELKYAKDQMVPERESSVIVVPESSLFVLGDNTENSYDSRCWDEMFVKESDVVGKVCLIN